MMKTIANALPLNPMLIFKLIGTLTPTQIDILKCIALFSMLIDHANDIFLPTPNFYLYAIGRTAMPLFCFVFALNMAKQPERWSDIARRQWIWAIITQPFFVYAFSHQDQPWYALNILFVFSVCSQGLAWMHKGTRDDYIRAILLFVLFAWPLSLKSYGVPGLALVMLSVAILRGGVARTPALIGWLLAILALNGNELFTGPWLAVVFMSILPTLIFPYLTLELVSSIKTSNRRFLPRQSFYWLYCFHLLLFPLLANGI